MAVADHGHRRGQEHEFLQRLVHEHRLVGVVVVHGRTDDRVEAVGEAEVLDKLVEKLLRFGGHHCCFDAGVVKLTEQIAHTGIDVAFVNAAVPVVDAVGVGEGGRHVVVHAEDMLEAVVEGRADEVAQFVVRLVGDAVLADSVAHTVEDAGARVGHCAVPVEEYGADGHAGCFEVCHGLSPGL